MKASAAEEDSEVVFRLPQVDAADFEEEDHEISFDPKGSKRALKRVLADVSNSPARVNGVARKPALRNFFWDKAQAPVWSSSAAVALDSAERDALCASFAKTEARAPKRTKTSTAKNSATELGICTPAAKSGASVLSIERRRQIGIVLARLRVDPGELSAALERLSGDDITTLLSGERLEMVLELAPTAEEVHALVGYKGDAATLDGCDKALATLAAVPKLLLRLRALQCLKTFDDTAAAMLKGASTLCAAAAELRGSAALAAALHTILAVGNCVNEGGTHGGASGFKLQSLGKLGHMKTKDGRSTMLDFVLRLLEQRHVANRGPTSGDGARFVDAIGAELGSLRTAAHLSFSAMCIDRLALHVRVQKMQDEIAATPGSPFAVAFGDFAARARATLDEHSASLQRAGASLRDLLLHFGEIDTAVLGQEPGTFQASPSQRTSVVSDAAAALFGTLLSFVEELSTAQCTHERSDREAREREARRKLTVKQPRQSRLAQPVRTCAAPAGGVRLLPPSEGPCACINTGGSGGIVSEMMQAANAKRHHYDQLHSSGAAVESPRTLTAKRAAVALEHDGEVMIVSQKAASETGAAQLDSSASKASHDEAGVLQDKPVLQTRLKDSEILEAQNSALQSSAQELQQQLLSAKEAAAVSAADMQETITKQTERIQKLEKVKMTNGHLKAVAKLKKENAQFEKDNAELRSKLASARKPSRLPGTPMSSRKGNKDAAELKQLRGALTTAERELEAATALAKEQTARAVEISEELDERTSALSTAQADIAASQRLQELVRTRCSKLEAKLAEIRSAGDAAEESFTEAEVSFDAQLQEKESEVAAVKELLAEQRSAAQTAQAELLAAEARARDLQTLADQHRLAASAKEQVRADALRLQQDAERELSALRAAAERNDAEVQRARDAVAQSEAAHEDALREWNEKAEAAEQRFVTLDTSHTDTKTQLATARGEIRQCETRAEAAEAEACQLKSALAQANQEANNAGEHASVAQSGLEARLILQESAHKEVSAQAAARSVQIAELETDLAVANELANELRGKLTAAQEGEKSEISELKSELQHALQSTDSARQEIITMEERCAVLEAQSAGWQEQVDQKQKQFDEFVTTSKQLEDGMESEIAELSREIESLTKANAALTNELEEHKSAAVALQSDLKKTQSNLAKMEKASMEQNAAAQGVLCELESTKARLVDVEQRLDEAHAQANKRAASHSPASNPTASTSAPAAASAEIVGTNDDSEPAIESQDAAAAGTAEQEKPATEKRQKKRKKLRGKKSLCPGAFAEIKNMLELGEADVVSLGKGKGFKCLGCGTKLPSKDAAEAHKQSCTMTG